MLKELQEFGLSEKEARVYLAALELGKATADQLAKQAKVNRSTTYVQLEALIKKGLASSYEEDKKTYFAAESPEYLRRLFEKNKQEFEQKQKELEKLLPGLKHLFETAGERPRVRFFEGKEGIITMREEFLKTKDKEIEVIYSFDAIEKNFTKEEREEYLKRRTAKGIKVRAIYTRFSGQMLEPPQLTEYKFIPENLFPIDVDVIIYGNNIGIAALKNKLIGVIIENEDIANSFRSIFNLAWQAAEKYQ